MIDSKSPKQAHQTLDCIGIYCPIPILQTREKIDKLAVVQILEVLSDDPAAEDDITA